MTSVPPDALSDWLAGEVAAANAPVAVLAGHFAIYSAGGAAVDLLDERDVVPPAAMEMTEFTRHTWRVACDAASRAREDPFHLVPLVDDIQFVRPIVGDRSTSERLAAALASEYLDRTPRLPAFHARELAARGLPEDRVLGHSDSRWLFSERELRIAAVRRIRRQATDVDRTRVNLVASPDGGTMTVTLPEHGDYCLVQAGHTSCAGGYLELLATLHERGVRTLLALVPARCLAQVNLGTTLARHLFSLPRFTVVNIGLSDAATGMAATVDRS